MFRLILDKLTSASTGTSCVDLVRQQHPALVATVQMVSEGSCHLTDTEQTKLADLFQAGLEPYNFHNHLANLFCSTEARVRFTGASEK